MGIEVTAGSLSSGLKALGGVIGKRRTIPILSCFELRDGKLFGSNLDADIEVDLPCSGKATLPAMEYHRLASMVRHIEPDEVLQLDCPKEGNEHGGKDPVLAFNGAEYKLPSLSGSDLPRLAVPETSTATNTSNVGLMAAMKRVARFVSSEETRYYLNGVCISRTPDGQQCVVATDGHRIAWHVIGDMGILDGEAGDKSKASVIIPNCAVKQVVSVNKEPETVTIVAPEKQRMAQFTWPGMVLTSKLIDGTYPDWRRILAPADKSNLLDGVTVPRAALQRALRRMVAMQLPDARAIKLSFEKRWLTLTATDISRCTFQERVALVDGPQKNFEIGFNCRYLMDILQSFSGADFISIEVSEQGSPTAFSTEDDGLHTLLMPMRI